MSCNEKNKVQEVDHAFFYGKPLFELSTYEKKLADQLGVRKIYVKFFDLVWNEENQTPAPINKLLYSDSTTSWLINGGIAVIPVVSITTECMEKIDESRVIALAERVHLLLRQMVAARKIKRIHEILFDCKWTPAMKTKYFDFLQYFTMLPLLENRTLSATIQFDQITTERSNIPPVNKVLLSGYYLPNVKDLGSTNPLIDVKLIKNFITDLDDYPLPVDISLPIFDQKVLFRENKFLGIITSLTDSLLLSSKVINREGNRFILLADTILNGYPLKKGDLIRSDQSNYEEILSAANLIAPRLHADTVTFALFHLDSATISKYSQEQINDLYNSFKTSHKKE